MNMLWNPTIEVENAHGIRSVSLQTHFLMNRMIFINERINGELANTVLSQFLFLEQQSDEPITIYLNSPGGEINAGLMIYDIIQSSKLEINTVCTGRAASMAAVLLAAGTPGHRYILRHSEVMIHEPLIERAVGGSATSIHNLSESILEIKETMNQILAKHTGKTMEEIDQATKFDNFMNAREAIDFGICDAIAESIRVAR